MPVNMIVQFGNWIFHIRNFLFPIFYLALFIHSQAIFSNTNISDVLGLSVIFLGILVRSITIGLVYIVRGGKNRKIYAENLVTSGIYSVCRNPMYLGNILLLMGFGLFSNSVLFLLVFFPIFVFFYYAIIKAEEAFLFRKFGEEFENYRLRVNALIPEFSKISTAFRGQHFQIKRVVKKEYNSLFIYFSGILLLLLYQSRISWQIFVIAFLALLSVYMLVKFLKYKHRLG